jgi:PEP-CTERM motif
VKHIAFVAVACFSMIAAAPSAFAGSNLLADGDFTSTAFSGPRLDAVGYSSFAAGASFGPWIVLSGNVDRITSLWNAPLTGNSVDLTGNTPGSIGQVLNLAAGTYELGFYLSGNPANLPLEKVIRVEAGSTSNLFSYTLPTGVLNQAAPYLLDYEYKTFRFQALGPTQLVFASLDEGPSLGGAVVGNVTVIPVSMPVPEPSTAIMMLAGLMSLLLVHRRSTQNHVGQR